MKKLSILFALTVLFIAGCQKDETDERDKFIGTYKGTMHIIVQSLEFNETAEGVYTITKSSADPNKLIINWDGELLTATVSGNSYKYDKFTSVYNDGSMTGTIEISGDGVISGNSISESGPITYSFYGSSYTGTWTSSYTKQ